MPMEKGFSSGHEIPDEEQREQDLEEKDEKKDENEEDIDEAEEEVKPNEAKEEEVIPNEAEEEVREEEDKEDDDGDDEEEEEEDSQDSKSGDQSEFMDIDLGEVYKAVQCPICLGIIKKTRTMMECLHRFCQECIEKSMRLGNKECPYCPSRRSLRDDPKFDALIAAMFADIDSYEKEEMNEDEKARNKEIQESIAQVSEQRKQKKGSTSRGTEEELRNEKN